MARFIARLYLYLVPLHCCFLLGTSYGGNMSKILYGSPEVDAYMTKVMDAVWRYMDVDCDGNITESEVSTRTATYLEWEPAQFRGHWDAMYCNYSNHQGDLSFLHKMVASLVVSAGRIDWWPCRFRDAEYYGEVNRGDVYRVTTEGSLNKRSYKLHMTAILHGTFALDFVRFPGRIDADKNGCLSEEDWVQYLAYSSTRKLAQQVLTFFLRPGVRNVTFSDIQESGPRLGINISNRGGCINDIRFAWWSAFDLGDLLMLPDHTAPCPSLDSTGEPSASEQSAATVTIVVVSAVLAVLLTFVLLGGQLYHLRYRSESQKMKFVQVMLQSKIDTWSTFDSRLRNKVSSLESSFIHCLGLRKERSGYICLQDFVHPDDVEALLRSLDQVKLNKGTVDGRFPLMVSARLRRGDVNNTSLKCDVEDCIQYIPMEVLLVCGSGSSVIVGLSQAKTEQSPDEELLPSDMRPDVPSASNLSQSSPGGSGASFIHHEQTDSTGSCKLLQNKCFDPSSSIDSTLSPEARDTPNGSGSSGENTSPLSSSVSLQEPQSVNSPVEPSLSSETNRTLEGCCGNNQKLLSL